MSPLPPIFIINRSQDTERRAQMERAYLNADLKPDFFQAVDGHGDRALLKPFIKYLGDEFWGKPEIKPGAFACFMSHRLLWQRMVDHSINLAVIAEDDSIPSIDFEIRFNELRTQLNAVDLIFLNDRMSNWAGYDFENVNSAIWNRLENPSSSRAPGGDGYALTLNGAKILLAASLEQKVFCGVDWFIVACSWNSSIAKHRDVKSIQELKLIWKTLGNRSNLIDALVLKNPLYTLKSGEKSKINHSEIIKIADFRDSILC